MNDVVGLPEARLTLRLITSLVVGLEMSTCVQAEISIRVEPVEGYQNDGTIKYLYG